MNAQKNKLNNAYMSTHQVALMKAQELIEKIQNYPNPESGTVNWGHIGELNHYIATIEEILGQRE